MTEASKILENLEKVADDVKIVLILLSNTVLTQVIFHNEKMYR